jgi:hypothetical protein
MLLKASGRLNIEINVTLRIRGLVWIFAKIQWYLQASSPYRCCPASFALSVAPKTTFCYSIVSYLFRNFPRYCLFQFQF